MNRNERVERIDPDLHALASFDEVETMDGTSIFETIAETSDLIELLGASDELRRLVGTTPDSGSMFHQLVELADVDTFATLAAIESLAGLLHTGADTMLARYLEHPDEIVRRHATWRLKSRPPAVAIYRPLVCQLTVGGIATMHAHRTLRTWSRIDAPGITDAIVDELHRSTGPAARARLVDALGAIGDPDVVKHLTRIALDREETHAARAAAVGAMAQHPGTNSARALRHLTRSDGDLGVHAAIAISDLSTTLAQPLAVPGEGLRIAQLTLAGELDRNLSRGGMGDTGGVASLLVSLGEALARRHDVSHVLTIGRGSLTDVVTDQLLADDGSRAYGTLAFGDETRPAESPHDSWEHLPSIERGIARVLRNWPTPDVLHLRMADVGALAGSRIAASLGVETCFSLAPDPHGVIHSAQARGQLDRRSFIDLATGEHVWFRARLVEGLARETPRLALFPRSEPQRFFDASLDDRTPGERRSLVVPEGIDLTLTERAERTVGCRHRAGELDHEVLKELAGLIPAERRHLPLLISAGRFSPIKGMDRVAAAWASDPELYESCTLVLVGGSLIDPSPVERSVLDAIDRAVPTSSRARTGLVLLGGRPRQDVAVLLAAVAAGYPGCWRQGGTYVNGAYKEEFGLAMIEALAAGLVVTGPNVGGPPTYVEPGVTGVLVDPGDHLGPALKQAFTLVDRPGRPERARALVEERYSIDTMAERLVELYAPEPAML